MIDNYLEGSYHSWDEVYKSQKYNSSIYIGDVQSALDLEFLKDKNIKTGIYFLIELLPLLKVWIMSNMIKKSSIQYILFSMARMRILLLFSIRSFSQYKIIFPKVVYWCIVLLEYHGYHKLYAEFHPRYLLHNEKIKNFF